MNLTNKTGIPDPLYVSIEILNNSHPEPEEGKYSVTELLKSPKQILLYRNHRTEVTKDLQQIIDTMIGAAWHKAIENIIISQDNKDWITETRLEYPIRVNSLVGEMDMIISGGLDLLWRDFNGDYHIVDWKTCKEAKVNKAQKDEDLEWKKQAFLYAFLVEKCMGVRPVDASMWAFPKDKTGAVNLNDPSTYRVVGIPWDLSDREFERQLLCEVEEKLQNIVHKLFIGMDERDCTAEERWQDPPMFAVKNPANKTAKRVLPSVADCVKYIQDNKLDSKYKIFERPSEPKKCMSWCDALPWCEQGQKSIAAFKATNARTFNYKGKEIPNETDSATGN